MHSLSVIKTLPAQQLTEGMQVICAISEPDSPEADLVSEFDHHLEADLVVVEACIIDNPVEYGYRPQDVAVQLAATVGRVVQDAHSVHVVLGGTAMADAIRLTPNTRVRVFAAASA